MNSQSTSDSRECDRHYDDETTLTPVLDSETFHQWKSELNGFLTQTQNRLTSLSQSLSEHHESQHQTKIQSDAPNDCSRPEPVAVPAEKLSTEIRSSSYLEQKEQAIEPETRHEPDEDIDALDRLSAIKLRLAKQIENAS
ncbi:hypothetical protein CA13_52690 [Planctomycetes bacterium CA13]|uniref:Uncharacterized protein n=1 Tax=Novipirellula herctigrandis TaxID=2527986 RepID=A0A5C5Z9B9_9BACT|nr:hypothetical protein CA13_52690 [Planctomycetes bacterium CA13]